MRKLFLLCSFSAAAIGLFALGMQQSISQTQVAKTGKAHEIALGEKPQSAFVSQAPRLNAEEPSWKESFEDWDQSDHFWLPDGWTRICSNDSLKEGYNTWIVNTQANEYAPVPVDGKVYAEILYTAKFQQDEWLISPAVTPKENEALSFTITYSPFGLFDPTYYVGKDKEFSQRIQTCNFQAYISVDGGEWQEIYNAWELHKDDNAWKMRLENSYGPEDYTVKTDLSAYVGKSIKVAFRYTGKDGDSMFLDNIMVGKPYVTASYTNPASLYLGMTADFQAPAPYLFIPDSVAHTWTNTSSKDCESFTWSYMAADKSTATETTKNLTALYYHTPEKVGSLTDANIFDLPTLTATATGVSPETYKSDNEKMKVGGKAYVNVGGQEYHTGAGTYNLNAGTTAMIGDNKEPIFGCVAGQPSNFWINYAYGREVGSDTTITVKAIYNGFDAPKKAYKVRGLWVQAIGQINEGANVTATIHKLTDAGAIDNDNILGTAILNVDSITYVNFSGTTFMTMPFVFDDPVTVDQTVFVRINGIDDPNVSYFAPLQSLVPDSYSHGYVSLFMKQGSTTGSSMVPLNYISTEQYGECYNSFYITLDAAYGDCDDWGHISGDNYIPDIEVLANTIHLEDDEDNIEEHSLRSAFYDNTKGDDLTLYVCAGNMSWGTEIGDTYHLTITLPKSSVGKMLNLYEGEAEVKYYDINTQTTLCTASSGELQVTETDENTYTVYLRAFDRKSQIAFSAKYNKTWKDYNAVKPNPNQYSVGTDNVTSLGSCVVDADNSDSVKIYLAHAEGVKTVEAMQALTDEQPIVISTKAEYLTGALKGFSQVKDKSININFRGNDYNYNSTNTDSVTNAIGGNLGGTIVGDQITIDFTIYSVISEENHNVKGHFSGTFWPSPYDVNGDGEVNVSDVAAIINVILGTETSAKSDINGDGIVNVSDIAALITHLLE